jgi:hypothetical protein
MKKILLTVMAFVLLAAVGQASAYVVNEGYLNISTPDYFSARYRSFENPNGQGEIYLGYDDLGIGNNRTEAQVNNWGYGTQVNTITFSYLPGQDKLTTTVVSPVSGTTTLDFNNLSSRFADPNILSNLNYMQFTVAARDSGVSVDFNDVYLNGESLGNFSAPSGSTTYLDWYLLGDFSQGFTLTGDIVLNEVTGTFSNGEASKVQVNVGYVPIPGGVWLLGSGLLGLVGLRSRFRS